MRKSTLFVLLISALIMLSSTLCFADAPDSSYQLLLNDEFTGTELNMDMWHYRLGDTYGGRNIAENVRIANDKLYLDYTKTNGMYSGAGIITNDYLPYGYYETRAKFFNGVNGLHTSFWTSGGALEIDGFESDTTTSTGTPVPFYNLHYWWGEHINHGGWSYTVDNDGNLDTSDWFTMGFEWLPGRINHYADGKLVGTTYPDVYTPSNLWLTAVATPEWCGFDIDDSKLDANGLFGSSEYEYFRYYAKKLKGVNLLGNGHFELSREFNSISARYFEISNNVIISKSAYAHDGYIYAYMPKDSTLGEEFKHLPSAKYTFEGYFKAPAGTSATLSVKDEKGNIIKSVTIPQCDEWALVSLKDVDVSNYASPVIEVKAGALCVDDITFYCQEGDATYENYAEGDYKTYNALSDSNAEVINNSLIAYLNSDVYCFKNNPFSFGSKLPYEQNGETYIPYQAIKEDITVETVPEDAEYVTLTQINASEDFCATANENCIIIYPSSYSIDSAILTEAQIVINNFIEPSNYFTREAEFSGTTDVEDQTVYTFDSAISVGTWSSSSLGYMSDGKFSLITTASATWPVEIEKTTKYSVQIYSSAHSGNASATPSTTDASVIFTTQDKAYAYSLNQYDGESGWYNLGTFDLKKDETISVKIYNATGEGILRASAIRIIPEDYVNATFVGTSDVDGQQVSGVSNCTLKGTWGNSSLGYSGTSKYSTEASATAVWTPKATADGTYTIHFYNIANQGNTASGASPSTKKAHVVVKQGENQYTYRLNQYDGNTGWYNLGDYVLKKDETLSIELSNISDGLLRANAIRLIYTPPTQPREAVYAGTSQKDGQKVYTITDCVLTGSNWSNSSLGYGSSSKYSPATDISATWNVTPDTSGKYSIQIYSIVHGGDANSGAPASTSAAGVEVKTETAIYAYTLNQRDGQMGWFDLGEFDLVSGKTIPVKLYRTISDGHLRANAVRLVPITTEDSGVKQGVGIFCGTSDESNQELHDFNKAVKTGSWLTSGGVLWDCYYGSGKNATATWTMNPQYNKKYSIQVYIPCINNGNTTTDAIVDLTVGSDMYEYHFNQRLATSESSGWYDLGLFDLTTSTTVTLKLHMSTGQFIRAKAVRLVPVPQIIQVVKSGTSVTAKIGFLKNHVEKVIFAEYNNDRLKSTSFVNPSASVNYTMTDSANSLKVFLWNSLENMQPLTTSTSK